MDKIGILGGTYNPIHFGHLRCALEAFEGLALKELLFIPSKIPPHRTTPRVSPEDRATMIALGIAKIPHFHLERLELQREGPSYSVPTLMELKSRYTHQALCFILGQDAFNQIHTWFQWEKILQLCHLVIMSRPSYTLELSAPIVALLKEHHTTDPNTLEETPFGKILMLPVTELAISSSYIRNLFLEKKRATFLLPKEVERYILSKDLYAHIGKNNDGSE